MYKIIYYSDKTVFDEFDSYDEYMEAVEMLPDEMPFDIDVQGDITIIDDGDTMEEFQYEF